MAYDFKKEFKTLYAPPTAPTIVDVPTASFLAVRGKGDPNATDGEYSAAMGLLYGVAYTLKMSHKTDYKIDGFFEYVVPPLEGFWWQDGAAEIDYTRKERFEWISLLRLPNFVTAADVAWAISEATRKKKADFSAVEMLEYDEGLCVQAMHLGAYDDEPATLAAMDTFARENGFAVDISDNRYHHEIYLTDPKKTEPAKLKTVLRHPIKTM